MVIPSHYKLTIALKKSFNISVPEVDKKLLCLSNCLRKSSEIISFTCICSSLKKCI